MKHGNRLLIRHFGQCDYAATQRAMAGFTDERDTSSQDEIWCLEHPPVYTLGLAGKAKHVLCAGAIPVIQSDRGGQVTYHGPGQLVGYLLIDLKRQGLSIKGLVNQIEQSIIDMLDELGLEAGRKPGAPGVYIQNRKIAALGLRVRRGCSYHGLALNVDMDTTPYEGINPCGYPGLEVTQLADYGIKMTRRQAAECLLPCLIRNLGYERYNAQVETVPEDLFAPSHESVYT
ncbi:MAG: lipoyl(octanoyl) transferase LipB [Gammaproteobacteria bacterium]